MPRGAHYLDGNFGRRKGYTYLSAEEVAGIGILLVMLGAVLILGCWYYKRRSGYKSLLSKSIGAATMNTLEDKSALLGSRFPLQEYTSNFNHVVVPDAPPAYDKISSSSLPPPYAP